MFVLHNSPKFCMTSGSFSGEANSSVGDKELRRAHAWLRHCAIVRIFLVGGGTLSSPEVNSTLTERRQPAGRQRPQTTPARLLIFMLPPTHSHKPQNPPVEHSRHLLMAV